MADEKNIQSKQQINYTLIGIAAVAIVIAVAVGIILMITKSVKANKVEEQLDLGEKYLSELEYEQAIAAYLEAIDIDPKCEDAYFALVDIYMAMGDYDEAEEILEDAEDELGRKAVKEKKKEFENKKGAAALEVETTTPEPETTTEKQTTPEPETTTKEPTTTEPETTTQPLPTIIELAFIPEDFTYGEKEGYYVCTGLSQSGYDKFREYNYEDEVILRFPSASPTGEVVEGLYSDKSSQYGLDKFLRASGAEVHLVCPDTFKIYYALDTGFDLGNVVSVELNYGLEVIGRSSFMSANITTIKIPETVRSIENRAFSNCRRLTIETLNTKDMVIGQDAFRDVTINEVIISDSLEIKSTETDYSGTRAIFYEANIGKITFEDGVTKIPEDIFRYCGSVKTVVIPDTVTEIGSRAFSYCENIKEIVIPNSVVTIGVGAFSGCASLESIIIPGSVTNIESGAFSNCVLLESITIPESVTSIGNGAFSDCALLKSIVIPKSMISIGDGVFSNCSALKTVIIPESITNIGEEAFSNCDSLESVTIPGSVKEIGDGAFFDCGLLKSINLIEGIERIGGSIFSNCYSLESVIIPGSVKEIGGGAFSDCTSLASITIPEKVINISYSMFNGCTSLGSVIIAGDVTNIEGNAFNGCTLLANIIIPESVAAIGSGAFSSCTSLESIIIPEGVSYIGSWTFSNCASLKSVTIPKSVSRIYGGAFDNSDNVVVYCRFQSYAERYAKENGIKYELIDGVSFPVGATVTTSEPVSFTLPEAESEAVFYVDVANPSSAIEVRIFNDADKFDAHVSYSVQYLPEGGEPVSIGSVGIAMYAADAINSNNTVSFLAENAGRYGIYIANATKYNSLYYSGTNVNPLQMTYRVIPPDTNEPNNDVQHATKINCNEYKFFNLLGEADADCFEVHLEEGVTKIEVTIGSESGRFDAALGYTISKYDAATNETTVVYSMWGSYASNAIKGTSTKSYTIETAGIYYINVMNAAARNPYYYSGDNESILYILVEPVK